MFISLTLRAHQAGICFSITFVFINQPILRYTHFLGMTRIVPARHHFLSTDHEGSTDDQRQNSHYSSISLIRRVFLCIHSQYPSCSCSHITVNGLDPSAIRLFIQQATMAQHLILKEESRRHIRRSPKHRQNMTSQLCFLS